MTPYAAPPAYSALASTSGRPSTLSRLERLPIHLLRAVLSQLPLSTVIYGVKPASRTLYTAANSVAREWAYSVWLTEVEMAARGEEASTDPLGGMEDGEMQGGGLGDTLPAYGAPSTATFPLSLPPRSRELAVFDLFLVALAQSSALLEASMLFSAENDSSALSAAWAGGAGSIRQDLFVLLQPRARVEDLVVAEARRQRLVGAPVEAGASTGESSSVGAAQQTVQADDIRVELKTKEAKLLLPSQSSSGRTGSVVWKAVVTAPRRREDSLEVLAKRLCNGWQRVALAR
ncbi:hypothetical protein JCM10213_009144 [Rhodosporidiobolus nylandii]